MEALLPSGCYLGIVFEQEPHVQQQVVEVHRIGLLAALLVTAVNLRYEGAIEKGIILAELANGVVARRQYQAVFGIGDATLHSTGFIDLFVEVHFTDDKLDKAEAVGSIVDGKVGVVIQTMPFDAKNAGKNAVEGAHPEFIGLLGRDKGGNTIAHLTGSLVGKGQGQNVPWLHALFQQIGHLVGKDTRLATTCSRNDERRSIDAKHRFKLTLIQFF